MSSVNIRIETARPQRILHALKRTACVQGLLLSGFFDLARRVLAEASENRGLDEPRPDFPVTKFEAYGSEWLGQVFNLQFPARLRINPTESVNGVRLRFGASRDFIEFAEQSSYPLTEPAVLKELDLELTPHRLPHDEGAQHQTNQASVSIQHGDSFIASLELL